MSSSTWTLGEILPATTFAVMGTARLFRNVVRGFSLVLHDPKGPPYKVWGVRNFLDNQDKAEIKAEAKLNSLYSKREVMPMAKLKPASSPAGGGEVSSFHFNSPINLIKRRVR